MPMNLRFRLLFGWLAELSGSGSSSADSNSSLSSSSSSSLSKAASNCSADCSSSSSSSSSSSPSSNTCFSSGSGRFFFGFNRFVEMTEASLVSTDMSSINSEGSLSLPSEGSGRLDKSRDFLSLLFLLFLVFLSFFFFDFFDFFFDSFFFFESFFFFAFLSFLVLSSANDPSSCGSSESSSTISWMGSCSSVKGSLVCAPSPTVSPIVCMFPVVLKGERSPPPPHTSSSSLSSSYSVTSKSGPSSLSYTLELSKSPQSPGKAFQPWSFGVSENDIEWRESPEGVSGECSLPGSRVCPLISLSNW
mmetsp:Transcript_10988/g.30374  ORF Transcript_10988/g.30374 Transcript_10988/m.30374 type:complete len:304 (-) Transcript_10988:257-1168(-)